MTVINSKILGRRLATQFDENTYYTQQLYNFWVDNEHDPDVLFKIKVYGYYKQNYKWSQEQADKFIQDNLESSRSWEINDTEYFYDWGAGINKITWDKMHEPNLDHIVPKEQGGEDTPENMRIRCRRLNENKGNTNSDIERVASIVDLAEDIEDTDIKKQCLIELKRIFNG